MRELAQPMGKSETTSTLPMNTDRFPLGLGAICGFTTDAGPKSTNRNVRFCPASMRERTS